MAKLTRYEWDFEFSPEGIADLCFGVTSYSRNLLIDQLERAWDESEDFEVEIELAMLEEPYSYFLRVEVCPSDEQVTIERRLP